jgi:PAS domain-containing protein
VAGSGNPVTVTGFFMHFRTIQQLADSNIIGVLASRDDGTILEANDEFLRMIGYSREDFDQLEEVDSAGMGRGNPAGDEASGGDRESHAV